MHVDSTSGSPWAAQAAVAVRRRHGDDIKTRKMCLGRTQGSGGSLALHLTGNARCRRTFGKRAVSRPWLTGAMERTRLQSDADVHAAALRADIARELKNLRQDAGLTRGAVAATAGLDASVVSRLESGKSEPGLATYARVAAALGADLRLRAYPNTGPAIRDRHSVPMTELLLRSRHPRWRPNPEVAVRYPARGWIDQVLWDPGVSLVVATELEAMLARIEQQLRWSGEKAASLPSSGPWADWARTGAPEIIRLLVVRWTRTNREAASAARRVLAAGYPADPRDALDALTGTATWPGPAILWARIDHGIHRLEPWRP
jgi:transcriptional regulator with XRE-family HTH domain